MTLLDAQEYDAARGRRRRVKIVVTIVLVVLIASVVWTNRYWQEKRVANKFFAALLNKDYETAYGIYFADPQWKQHPGKHASYAFSEFYRDWGPGGEWGVIKSYEIYGISDCPKKGTGVVVDVIVNQRAEHAQVYVDKSDKTVSSPPCDLLFR